jgi:TusA-related sulfurtransferase
MEPTHFLDNRGLSMPEPMMRTLETLEAIQSGEVLEIHNDRKPTFLLMELKAMRCRYEVEEQPDGTIKVRITKK